MMASAVNRETNKNYYVNPTFSQQSEFYNAKSHPVPIAHKNDIRQSPVGAQHQVQYHEDDCGEQEFYEEMLVDDTGIIKEKKVLVVSSPSERSYSSSNHVLSSRSKSRYEYIPMQEQPPTRYVLVQNQKVQQHRYAVIESEDVPQVRPQHRYEYIQDDYSPQRSRYEYIQQPPSSPRRPPPNPVATQKLHELLATPKKSTPRTMATSTPQRVLSPPPQRRTPQSPPKDPFVTPKKSRAQQKLNYAIGTRQMQDKRTTAIVAPMCSSPVQSDSTNNSWMNLSGKTRPGTQFTLAAAAVMMMLCGGVTSGLCFYMVSIMGRLYFLDFGTVAGFTCFVLGLLGYKTRNCYWLPNRNYISGYILLSVLSLLMCAGLLVLMVLRPRAGTPLADMTSGAICGISVLSLILACAGVMTSYCCKYPPPDNRVEHSVPGFTV